MGIVQWLTASCLIIVIILVLYLIIRSIWEPTQLQLTTVKVGRASEDALRILHLSDLHSEMFRIKQKKLLAICEQSRPDLIVFTGDICAKTRHEQKGLDLLAAVRQAPSLIDVPFAAVRGNHDDPDTFRQLSGLGITIFENDGMILTKNSLPYALTGIDDLRTGQPDIGKAFQAAEAAGIPPDRRLVIAHNPDTLLELPEKSAGLFLSGHFHGGQIRTPCHLEFWLLRSEKLPKMGYRRGFLILRGIPSYISRGLGCVLLPLRLFSRPEVVLLEFGPDA